MLILCGEGKDFTREVSAEARKLSYFNALGDKHFVNLATRRISLPKKNCHWGQFWHAFHDFDLKA